MKILIFIEHDVMIRHFIDSQSFNSLINKHQVVFIFPEKGHKRVTRKIDNRLLNAPYLHLTINQKRQKIWKRLFQVNHLRWKNGQQQKALRIFPHLLAAFRTILLADHPVRNQHVEFPFVLSKVCVKSVTWL